MMLKQFAQFDLGKSFFYPKDVWHLIKEKLPVSISLGLWTFFLSYLVSVPLGIAKAVRAGTRFDALTSLLVLVGYAIPGFVLGVALLVIFGGQLQWFPLRGLTSSNWEQLSWGAKVVDYLWHIALPVTASVLGSFAVITMLTKNAFLEEIRKQYVLTARAKGLAENRVLYRHVMRNALIPLVTGFPAAFIGAFFTGSLLIETLFSLDGLGLLSYEAVIRRDYPVVLGTLYLFTLIGLVTKLISDLCYCVGGSACEIRPMNPAVNPTVKTTSPAQVSPTVRAWQRFKRNRLGFGSLVVFLALFVLSLGAEFWSNDKPLVVRFQGQWYVPVVQTLPEKLFGGDFETPPDYLDPFIQQQLHKPTAIGRCKRSIPITTARSNYFRAPAQPCATQSHDNCVGHRRPGARCAGPLDLWLSGVGVVCTGADAFWRGAGGVDGGHSRVFCGQNRLGLSALHRDLECHARVVFADYFFGGVRAECGFVVGLVESVWLDGAV